MESKLKTEETKESGIQPIDHQLVKSKIRHVLVTIPALDERWVHDRKFAFYVFPPTRLKNGSYIPGAKETWMSFMSCVLDDIWWLCELPYHKFWSQIIYNKNSINGVKSFLHLAPLEKLYYRTKDSDILSTHKRVKKAVFQFLKRVSRSKESELHFMTDSKYREIMSDYEIIPISSVFCICSIYGKKYREDVYSIVSQIFKWNSNLKFEQAVVRTTQLFDHLHKKLKISYKELKKNLLCSENTSDVTDAANAYKECLLATLQFLANSTLTVSNFLSIYKEGCQVFLNRDFDFHIIRVYEKLLIPLAQEIDILFQDCQQTQTSSWLYSLIDLTRLELTKTFEICLNATLNKMSDTRITQDFIRRHIKLIKYLLKAEEFLQDLNSYCNVVDIIDKIRRKCPGNLDLSDVDRITETVKEFLSKTESDLLIEKRKSPDVDGELVQWNEIIDYVKEYYDSDEELFSGSENVYPNGVDGMFSDDLSDLSDWSDESNSNSEYESYLAGSGEEEDSVIPIRLSPAEKNAARDNETRSQLGEPSLQPGSSSSNVSPEMTLSQVQLQSAITHVKDFLPHLGDGFVAMCLEYYKMDSSVVINAILEEALPPYLKSLDFSLPKVSEEVQQKINSALENMTGKACVNGLKELKRVEYSSYNEMLNDKKAVRDAKNVYEGYRNIEEDEVYDDDVDDEIDEMPVAALEPDPEGFYNEYAKIPLHNCNRSQKELPSRRLSADEIEENENDSQSPSNGPKPLDFCENPEITRARREHYRQVAYSRKHPRGPYNNSNQGRNRKDSNREDSTNENASSNKNSHDNRNRKEDSSKNGGSRGHEKPSSNTNSYQNREGNDRSWQNRVPHENRDRNERSTQSRNSFGNRDRNERSIQSRDSYENRDRNERSTQNRDSFANRDRNERSTRNRDSFENRDRNERSTQNRDSYEHRERNEGSLQNGNSFENRDRFHKSSSQNWNSNHERHENRDGRENRYDESASQNWSSYESQDRREHRDRRENRHDKAGSQNWNSFDSQDRQENREPRENRPWRSNDSTGDNVSRERHFKNVHKARHANHNRKFCADKKRQF